MGPSLASNARLSSICSLPLQPAVTVCDFWARGSEANSDGVEHGVASETFLSRKYSPLGAKQGSPAVTVNHLICNAEV